MSLLNLGYGLGGFMQGYDQQQQQALRNSVVQQQLAQLQRQYAAQRILGGLGGGSLGGLGGGLSNFQQQMPATSPAPLPPQFGGDSGSSTPPPMPGTSSSPGPQAGGDQPSPPPQFGGGPNMSSVGGNPAQDRSNSQAEIARTVASQNAAGNGTSGSSVPIPSQISLPQDVGGSQPATGAFSALPPPPAAPSAPAPPPIPPAPALPTPAAAPPTATPTSAAQETPPASAAGTASTPDRSGLFSDLLDPSKQYEALGTLRDRIAQAAPEGTDPAVIWEATQELYKLTGGSALQRAQLGAYLKMAGLDVQTRGQTIRAGTAAAGMQSRERIAAANRDASYKRMTGTQDRIDARAAAREADRKVLEAQRNQNAAAVRRLQAIRAQIAAINAKAAGGAPSKEDQATLDRLGKELADIDTSSQQTTQ